MRQRIFFALACVCCIVASLAIGYFCFARNILQQVEIAAESAFHEIEFAQNDDPLKGKPAERLFIDSSPDEKAAYRKLYQALWLQKDSVTFNDMEADELFDIHTRMRYDHPELFHVDHGARAKLTRTDTLTSHSVTTLELSYLDDPITTSQKRITLEEKVHLVLEGLTTDMTDAQKAAFLHDRLCELVDRVDEGNQEKSIYGHDAADALLGGEAACEGYALAYGLLCDAAGLDNQVVVGFKEQSGEDFAHAWNRVSIDGHEIYVDVTFDDGLEISQDYLFMDDSTLIHRNYRLCPNNVFPSS